MDEKWIRDTGLIFALAALFFVYKGFPWGLPIAAFLIFSVLFVPRILWPLAWAWQGVVQVLGMIMPKIFFSLVFFLIITPVGLVRKFFVQDSLVFFSGKNPETAFIKRNHLIRKEHLIKPY